MQLFVVPGVVVDAQASELERLTDQCSGDVVISSTWPDSRWPPDSEVIINLPKNAPLDGWTASIAVNDRQIRWFCHSQAGWTRFLDPGVWVRAKDDGNLAKLSEDVAMECARDSSRCEDDEILATVADYLEFGRSDRAGWFAERSRCESGTKSIRARRGPDREFYIQCLSDDAETGAAVAALRSGTNSSGRSSACADSVQGRVAWNYDGSKTWQQSNIQKLCQGAETTAEPAKCFQQVMHGGVNWGGGARWQWSNALNLCKGTQNASSTVSCFKNKIGAGSAWPAAIDACNG